MRSLARQRENGIGTALMKRNMADNVTVFLGHPGRKGIG
jgi:hypothetical protein